MAPDKETVDQLWLQGSGEEEEKGKEEEVQSLDFHSSE